MLRRRYRKTYSVPIKKQELDDGRTITCKLKFIDSFIFMSSNLSDLINNLSESVEGEEKEKKLYQYAILQDFKIINYIINATNIKKTVKTNIKVN